MKIHPFIFSWRGQYDRACQTEKALIAAGYPPIVINSDPDNNPSHWINLGDGAWFSQQWQLATHMLRGDVMFHIQADATYDNWAGLIADAEKYFEKYNCGIYAPWTHCGLCHPLLDGWKSEHTELYAGTNTDCTCWFLSADLIKQFLTIPIDWKTNKIGWGIDCIMSGLSWSNGKIVLVDKSHVVFHHPGRGYSSETATNQMWAMINQLPVPLQQIISKQWQDKEGLLHYLPHNI